MRSDTAPDYVFRQSHRVTPRVSSWLGDSLLSEDLPILSGALQIESTRNVRGRLTLSLPRVDGVTGADASDPLAAYGQRLRLEYVASLGAESWTVPLGWYMVQGWSASRDEISVEAVSLEQVILDDRFLKVSEPPAGATYASEIERLSTIPVSFDLALTDRALPSGQVWEDDDRLKTINELAAAWPATYVVDDDGVLSFVPEFEVGAPVVTWAPGADSSYLTAETEGSRDTVYNAVVARGETSAGVEVWAIATDSSPTSPTRWGGPFGRKPRFYSSPLITTSSVAASTAKALLQRERRRFATRQVVAPPDPRIEIGDTATVTEGGVTTTGLVTAITLPLTAKQGAATYTLSTQETI